MKTVQNEVPALEDIKPVIDEKIVDTFQTNQKQDQGLGR
jgi:hypothetical protein